MPDSEYQVEAGLPFLADLPGHYQVDALLYSGSQTRVYRGRAVDTGMSVVLKCFEPEAQAAYRREVGASLGLSHPHLNTCLDTFYLAGGWACMVYEFLPGGNLREWLNRYGRMSVARVFVCLEEVLRGLQYLHQAGLIHCDLKPENILLSDTDPRSARYVIGDLGATASEREGLSGKQMAGSPAYLSPERLHARYTFNSDLYSLGVIGFELLTGSRPFNGGMNEIYRAHLSQPPPLERIEHSGLRDFLEKLLLKDPRQRIAGVDEALALLKKIGNCRDITENKEENRNDSPVAPAVQPRLLLLKHLQHRAWIPLDYLPENLLLMNHGEEVLLGGSHEGRVEVSAWRGDKLEPLHVLLSELPLQILEDGRVVYASHSRVLLQDLTRRERRVLWEDCRDIQAFHLSGEYLVWCGARSGHVCHLPEDREQVYKFDNYLLNPQVLALEDGASLNSQGSMNHVVVLRDVHARPKTEWTLDGPVLCLTARNRQILCLTLNLNTGGETDNYTLWRLEEARPPRGLSLGRELGQWCTSPGRMFWLDTGQFLYTCGPGLHPYALGRLPFVADQLQITPDHRFLATASLNSGEEGGAMSLPQAFITLWENPLRVHC